MQVPDADIDPVADLPRLEDLQADAGADLQVCVVAGLVHRILDEHTHFHTHISHTHTLSHTISHTNFHTHNITHTI